MYLVYYIVLLFFLGYKINFKTYSSKLYVLYVYDIVNFDKGYYYKNVILYDFFKKIASVIFLF